LVLAKIPAHLCMTYFLTTPKINGRDIKTVVGAWATGSGISLGQIDVDGKSN
jgi:hypothetical protein